MHQVAAGGCNLAGAFQGHLGLDGLAEVRQGGAEEEERRHECLVPLVNMPLGQPSRDLERRAPLGPARRTEKGAAPPELEPRPQVLRWYPRDGGSPLEAGAGRGEIAHPVEGGGLVEQGLPLRGSIAESAGDRSRVGEVGDGVAMAPHAAAHEPPTTQD